MQLSWGFTRRSFGLAMGFALAILLAPAIQAAPNYKVLYRFTGQTDGAFPNAIIMDSSGNLYGTTQWGGDLNCNANFNPPGCGVVFQLTPSGDGHWHEHVLYAFQGGADGGEPTANLLLDASGNLYGTTTQGGNLNLCDGPYSQGCGVVFELSPQGNGSWTESVLYSFQYASDGSQPSWLTFDRAGNLYGTSYFDLGNVVFEISPPEQKGNSWTEQSLYESGPYLWLADQLTLDAKGNIYGTWFTNSCCGGVFRLQHSGRGWQESNLFYFGGAGNGNDPQSGVILDSKGRMYGALAAGGNNWGVAFELKRSGDSWDQLTLHNFCSRNYCVDGASPVAPLVFDQLSNLYGTTEYGGGACGSEPDGCGVVFKLAPTRHGPWKETVLHRFKGGSDGYGPNQPVVLDDKGHVYGTTANAGSGSGYGYGTVFEVTTKPYR